MGPSTLNTTAPSPSVQPQANSMFNFQWKNHKEMPRMVCGVIIIRSIDILKKYAGNYTESRHTSVMDMPCLNQWTIMATIIQKMQTVIENRVNPKDQWKLQWESQSTNTRIVGSSNVIDVCEHREEI